MQYAVSEAHGPHSEPLHYWGQKNMHSVCSAQEQTICLWAVLCGRFSRLESYCIYCMHTLPVRLFSIWAQLCSTPDIALEAFMRLVILHHLVVSVVEQLLNHMTMHLQQVCSNFVYLFALFGIIVGPTCVDVRLSFSRVQPILLHRSSCALKISHCLVISSMCRVNFPTG